MKRVLSVLGALMLIAPSVASAGGGRSAADFLKQHYEYTAKGQYGRDWDNLHPAQQWFISRDRYMDCTGESLGGTNLSRIRLRVEETYREKISIPGTALRVWSTAVTFKLTEGGESDFVTWHAVLVKGKWKWTISASGARAYKAGRCPP